VIDYLLERLQYYIDTENVATPSKAQEKKSRALDRRKVYLLDKYIFPGMADLVFFIQTVNADPRLQELFEDDLKDLFGLRQFTGDYLYSGTLARLLQGMLFDGYYHDDNSVEGVDYRTILANIIMDVVEKKLAACLKQLLGENEMSEMSREQLRHGKIISRFCSMTVNKDKGAASRQFEIPYIQMKKNPKNEWFVRLLDSKE